MARVTYISASLGAISASTSLTVNDPFGIEYITVELNPSTASYGDTVYMTATAYWTGGSASNITNFITPVTQSGLIPTSFPTTWQVVGRENSNVIEFTGTYSTGTASFTDADTVLCNTVVYSTEMVFITPPSPTLDFDPDAQTVTSASILAYPVKLNPYVAAGAAGSVNSGSQKFNVNNAIPEVSIDLSAHDIGAVGEVSYLPGFAGLTPLNVDPGGDFGGPFLQPVFLLTTGTAKSTWRYGNADSLTYVGATSLSMTIDASGAFSSGTNYFMDCLLSVTTSNTDIRGQMNGKLIENTMWTGISSPFMLFRVRQTGSWVMTGSTFNNITSVRLGRDSGYTAEAILTATANLPYRAISDDEILVVVPLPGTTTTAYFPGGTPENNYFTLIFSGSNFLHYAYGSIFAFEAGV